MNSKFGFLSKLNFLQDLTSFLISIINPAIIHNVEKYFALKKVHYLSAIEEIEGDYLEFGVYTGSSFCHSIRCAARLRLINPEIVNTKFYGFDSFEGFGELDEEDDHPFYKDSNFETNYEVVNNRVLKVAKGFEYKLVKGLFNETLKVAISSYGIKTSRIVFIDSDTYSSSIEALRFVSSTLTEGSYIVLDDYFSYRGSYEKGVAKAFKEIIDQANIVVRQVFTYGMGGAVFVVSRLNDLPLDADEG